MLFIFLAQFQHKTNQQMRTDLRVCYDKCERDGKFKDFTIQCWHLQKDNSNVSQTFSSVFLELSCLKSFVPLSLAFHFFLFFFFVQLDFPSTYDQFILLRNVSTIERQKVNSDFLHQLFIVENQISKLFFHSFLNTMHFFPLHFISKNTSSLNAHWISIKQLQLWFYFLLTVHSRSDLPISLHALVTQHVCVFVCLHVHAHAFITCACDNMRKSSAHNWTYVKISSL